MIYYVLPILPDSVSFGSKITPESRLQENLTASRNFIDRKMFEGVRRCYLAIWFLLSLHKYPVAAE